MNGKIMQNYLVCAVLKTCGWVPCLLLFQRLKGLQQQFENKEMQQGQWEWNFPRYPKCLMI